MDSNSFHLVQGEQEESIVIKSETPTHLLKKFPYYD